MANLLNHFFFTGLCCLTILSSWHVSAEFEWVPLEDIRMPSDDLYHPGLGHLSSEKAWELKHRVGGDAIDLSRLNPLGNDIWNESTTSILAEKLDEIALNSSDRVSFEGLILSNSGLLRFNALATDTKNGSKQRFYTIALDKTLHTTLLRKNLLRKLGYVIPPMKYLKKLIVDFGSLEEKNGFIERHIPEKTLGAPARWVIDNEPESLSLTLQDVVAFAPSETDHYNLAMGVPPKVLTSRTLRSLITSYALLDLGESVNKFNWVVGRESNNGILLPHETFSTFNATMDDVTWSLRRLAKLKREDFQEIVKLSFFPEAVEKVLIEKIISRRNMLISLFNIEASIIEFEAQPNFANLLIDGKLKQEKWDGYAARFAHGDPESPFQNFQYFFLSKLQSVAIDTLISRANKELSLFNVGEARSDYFLKEFNSGLDHFIKTGEFLDLGVGTWVSPIVNGDIILSRDIVVGYFLGTDSLVQLADTFGVSVELGATLGIEKFPHTVHAAVTAKAVAIKTWTHLKPVKTLKGTFKEPYQNIIVPLVKMGLLKQLEGLSEFPEQSAALTDKQKEEKLSQIMVHLNKYLGVGESLLMTERIAPSAVVNGGYTMLGTNLSLGLGVDKNIVRRVHLHRKDSNTIQIYDDNGSANSVQFSFSMSNNFPFSEYRDKTGKIRNRLLNIPLVQLRSSLTKGDYKVKVHEINIDHDLNRNPDLFKQANALSYFMNSGSTELLTAIKKPYQIHNNFKDKSTRFSLLVWRNRYLNQSSMYTIDTPLGGQSKLLSLQDASQQGINYEDFAKELLGSAINSFIQGKNFNVNIATRSGLNPAYSIGGVSKTTLARFESRIVGEVDNLERLSIADPFLSISKKKEGWGISKKDLKSMIKELNEKYGKRIFDEESLNAMSGMKLYEVTVNLNLYEDAIYRLEQIDLDSLRALEHRYIAERAYLPGCRRGRDRNSINPQKFHQCGHMGALIRIVSGCLKTWRENSSGNSERAKCYMKVAKSLEETLDFVDFEKLIGENNFYLYGQIQGFQDDSETLKEPIKSHTKGRINGPYWDGPVEYIRQLIGVQNGELRGQWMREVL